MPENRNNKGDLKPITVLCAMDVYLPQMDGVINCMRNYLLNYPEDVKGVAACPKPREELHEPYPIIYYRSFRVPFTKIDFGFPSLDKKFYDTVMNTDIDLIHVHAPFGVCKVLTKVAREKNIPIVSHVHTNYREVFRKITRNPLIYIPYVNTLGKRYSKTDVMFAGTEATERLLRRDYKYTGEVSIVPFGTNLLKPDDIDSLKKPRTSDSLSAKTNSCSVRSAVSCARNAFSFLSKPWQRRKTRPQIPFHNRRYG